MRENVLPEKRVQNIRGTRRCGDPKDFCSYDAVDGDIDVSNTQVHMYLPRYLHLEILEYMYDNACNARLCFETRFQKQKHQLKSKEVDGWEKIRMRSRGRVG